MTVHELLVDARNLIARGWIQGQLQRPEGVCARGGLMRAAKGGASAYAVLPDDVAATAARLVAEADMILSGLLLGRDADRTALPHSTEWMKACRRVIAFNNAPGRIKGEVLALFDEAIALTAPEPSVELTTPEPEPVA